MDVEIHGLDEVNGGSSKSSNKTIEGIQCFLPASTDNTNAIELSAVINPGSIRYVNNKACYQWSASIGYFVDDNGKKIDHPTGRTIKYIGGPEPGVGTISVGFTTADDLSGAHLDRGIGGTRTFHPYETYTVTVVDSVIDGLTDGKAYITAAPSMPQGVSCHLNPSASGGTVQWNLKVAYDLFDAPPNQFSGNSSTWNISNELNGTFCGGTATLSYTLDGMKGMDKTFYIRGTNPTQSQIFSYASTIEEEAVCWKESSFRQFNGTGLPLYGPPNGWGLMQKDPPPSLDYLWNWQVNLQGGVDYLNLIYGEAETYLLGKYNPSTWIWNPANRPDKIWDDAFCRYNSGKELYDDNGNVKDPNNPEYSEEYRATLIAGINYSNSVRAIINNEPKPW